MAPLTAASLWNMGLRLIQAESHENAAQREPRPPVCEAEELRPRDVPPAEVPGLYVHVPFCFHKCHYCDFYSITRQTPQRMGRFVDRVLAEAEQWADSPARVRPRTVFFGGGTPSLLPGEEMRRLILGLRDRFDLSRVDEWTVEVNPATASTEYCRMLRESGVDRLSFGAQSFDPAELKMLERHHDPGDVPRSLEIARMAGFSRLNIDLIFAIPGQDLASWAKSLDAAIGLRTPHISCYGLTYEPNTAMTMRKRLGQFRAVEEPVELEMLRHARRRLATEGYRAYEISNYAVPGEECRHNLLYWDGGNYIGLGPSAASHVEGWRWKNRPHLGEWEEAIDAGVLPAAELERLSEVQRRGEWLMLRLRLAEGVGFDEYARRFGGDVREQYGTTIDRIEALGLIEADAKGLRLSEEGVRVADAVAGEFVRDD
jgi:oxygen-independent coproporphyrinogen-3 oxidase